MPSTDRPIILVTRGSALALTQTQTILAQCRAAFPDLAFDMKIVKTTGDKLQRATSDPKLPPPEKGLFTKELEIDLLNETADLAIHSLKDLPTDLPQGLTLGAVSHRADVRDVLIYRAVSTTFAHGRGLVPHASVENFPQNAVIGTGSTRRQAQLTAIRGDFKYSPIRGNVGTRLKKLATQSELDGIVLAAAGLNRLHFHAQADGKLQHTPDTRDGAEAAGDPDSVPDGLLASYLSLDMMLPCVGQAAIGIEIRANDPRSEAICARLNDLATFHCVSAERAFLAAMGGGCLSPIAAYAEIVNQKIHMRAVSFTSGRVQRGETKGDISEGVALAESLAKKLSS